MSDEAAERLSRVLRELSLWDGLARPGPGSQLGDVSHAIEASVDRSEGRSTQDWGIVEGFGGHGIGTAMHMDPHISELRPPGHRAAAQRPEWHWPSSRCSPPASPDTAQLDDGWTIVTADGSLAAHWEHTVALFEDGPVGPHRPGRRTRAELAARGVELTSIAA